MPQEISKGIFCYLFDDKGKTSFANELIDYHKIKEVLQNAEKQFSIHLFEDDLPTASYIKSITQNSEYNINIFSYIAQGPHIAPILIDKKRKTIISLDSTTLDAKSADSVFFELIPCFLDYDFISFPPRQISKNGCLIDSMKIMKNIIKNYNTLLKAIEDPKNLTDKIKSIQRAYQDSELELDEEKKIRMLIALPPDFLKMIETEKTLNNSYKYAQELMSTEPNITEKEKINSLIQEKMNYHEFKATKHPYEDPELIEKNPIYFRHNVFYKTKDKKINDNGKNNDGISH